MVTSRFAMDFARKKCNRGQENVHQVELLCEDEETARDFSYLGDRIYSKSGCVAAVTSRTKLGCVTFIDCQDVPCRKNNPQKIKDSVYKGSVRSAMLHGSDTWCSGQKEVGILRRNEGAIVRMLCGV